MQEQGGRRGTVHDIELEQNTVAEKQGDTVNIDSFSFNSICVVIIELKTSCSQNMHLYNTKLIQAMMAI